MPTTVVSPSSPTVTVEPVTLALQGGGALGAFTWGVLDRLLDEPRLDIAVVSGASAGAMNAAMLVQGLATGGPEGGAAEARRLLETFWRRVAVAAGSPDLDSAPWLRPLGALLGPMAGAVRHAAMVLPPSRLATLGLNPLRRVLDGLLDPAIFGRPGAPALVVSATRLRSGEARLFRDAEVTAEVLLASACLPQFYPPVEIEGELYWDGGYASNPPIRPLIEAGAPSDVILVRTTPIERPEPPQDSVDIRERTAEMAFGAALRQELRSVAVAQRLLADLPDPPPAGSPNTVTLARLRAARLHAIGSEEALRALPGGSALDTSWASLRRLHELGAAAAEHWLAVHLADLGQRSTLDLEELAQPLVELAGTDQGPPGT